MKISKITIKSLFGIKEWSGDGKNIELVGDNGTGKTSVIDAIRYALTNASDREYIIKNGETDGEIFIETDSGLSIDRKPRQGMTDYKSVKQNGNVVPSPEIFRGNRHIRRGNFDLENPYKDSSAWWDCDTRYGYCRTYETRNMRNRQSKSKNTKNDCSV